MVLMALCCGTSGPDTGSLHESEHSCDVNSKGSGVHYKTAYPNILTCRKKKIIFSPRCTLFCY